MMRVPFSNENATARPCRSIVDNARATNFARTRKRASCLIVYLWMRERFVRRGDDRLFEPLAADSLHAWNHRPKRSEHLDRVEGILAVGFVVKSSHLASKVFPSAMRRLREKRSSS